MVAVALRRCGLTGGNPDRHQGKSDSANIGQHVPGVGKERQAAREQPAGKLRDHVAGGQNEDNRQTSAVSLSRVGVVDVCMAALKRSTQATRAPRYRVNAPQHGWPEGRPFAVRLAAIEVGAIP